MTACIICLVICFFVVAIIRTGERKHDPPTGRERERL